MMAVVTSFSFGQYSYVAILAFVMVGCLWLEIALRTRVFRRWRRMLLSIAPALVLFVIWDVYAIAQGHWWFDPDLILGIHLPGDLPWTRFSSSSRSRSRPCSRWRRCAV